MRRAFALLLAGGCRSILGIEEATIDDNAANDEDADGIADLADNCPTVANVDQLDGDGDDVGNPCDPANGLPNRIAFYTAMLDGVGLVLGPNTAISDGFAAIRTSQISLVEPFKPVRIEAVVSFRTALPSQQFGIELDVGSNFQWTCFAGFKISSCAGLDCLRLKLPTQNVVFKAFDRTSLLTKLVLDTRSTGSAACIGEAAPVMETVKSAGQIVSTGAIRISATGDAEVFNLIVYE